MKKKIRLYDSTLRDGAQTRGVNFSLDDKLKILEVLDEIGVDFVEGGWPGANPTDDKLFKSLPKLKNSKLVAFGMMRKHGKSSQNDPGLNAVLNSGVSSACLVGKSWDFQVKNALRVPLNENLDMISDTISFASKRLDQIMFDAEHFFDGYKNNREYSLESIRRAFESGAEWIVLCDTNGGTLPYELENILSDVKQIIPEKSIGVHFHNDTDNATYNSIESVRYGVGQVQGTFNGLGERCGNANLVNVASNIILKMGYDCKLKKKINKLTKVSRYIDETLNRESPRNLPFVGSAAFAHKGGLHISAVEKDPRCYEHINPEKVGNERVLVISNQSGKSNIVNKLKKLKIDVKGKEKDILNFLEKIKQQEFLGYAYDGAEASFELLARRKFQKFRDFYKLESFKVSDEKRMNSMNEFIPFSEAIVKIFVGKKEFYSAAEGNGPINALDLALRNALVKFYPKIKELNLIDYKVRILTPQDGTKALVRVRIESRNKKLKWSTIGVSFNVIDASYIALNDSITYHLLKS
ncbi:MAG: citramalate synthase [Pseudomonadota bacterium]|nr:citramalate synthase [Pseudomonadota bacterium]